MYTGGKRSGEILQVNSKVWTKYDIGNYKNIYDILAELKALYQKVGE